MPKSYRQYKTDADKAKVYDHRVQQAEEQNRKWHSDANRWYERYENKEMEFQKSGDGHRVNAPLGISIIDALYSAMTAADVDVTVTARGHGTEDQEYLATAALSGEWNITRASSRAADAVKDALIVGIGCIKVGYEYYEEVAETARPDEDVREEVDRLFKEAQSAGKEAPSPGQIAGLVPLTQEETYVLEDRIVVDYVPWDMLLWDPTAKRWEDLRWVAQRSLVHPDEVRNNPVWREYAKRTRGQLKRLDEVKADTHVHPDVIGINRDPETEDERCTVYELHDLDTGTICTFIKGQDWLLSESPNPFALNADDDRKNPYVPLVLRKSNSRIRGVSDMEVLEPTLEEVDLYHSRLATYIERFTPKILAPAGMFGENAKNAIASQEYGAIVETDQAMDPSLAVPFSPPTLPAEVFGVPDKLEVQAREGTGVNEIMRGLFPDRKRTATETSEVVSASAVRQAEKRTALEHFFTEIGRRVLQLMQMFYEEERVARWVDEIGPGAWNFTSADIAFEFDLEINLTPKEATTWQARSDKAMAALNILGPMAQQPDPATGAPPVNVTELLRYVLTELNFPRRIIAKILALPEEQQKAALGALQNQAAGAVAAEGVTPPPGMVPGPMDDAALAAATNQGALPPELLAAAQGINPLAPDAAEQVSESAGVANPQV